MLNQIRRLNSLPEFEDERQNRAARLLNDFLLGVIALTFAGTLVFPFIFTEMLIPLMGMFGVQTLIYIGCLVLLHRRHFRTASVVFVAAFWMLQTLAVAIGGGMTSPTILNYATPILIAGFLSGLPASLGLALLTSLVGAGFVYLAAIGIVVPPINPMTQSIGWVTLIFNLLGMAVIQHWAVRSLNQVADRAQYSERTLAQHNCDLEREIMERKRAETALRASENRYRIISELVSDYAFSYRPRPDGTWVIEMLLGSPKHVTGYEVYELNKSVRIYHREDEERVRCDVERTLHGEITEGDYRIVTKSNEIRWVHVRRKPMRGAEENRYEGYYAAIQEITQRKQAEEALRQNEEHRRQFLEKLKILHEIDLELSKAQSFDDLCRQAVELGRSRLGFDRLSVWFMDSDPKYLVGSYGTDENGLLRDERGQRVPVHFSGEMKEILDGRVLRTTTDEAPVFNDHQQVVGYGWKAAAKLSVVDKNIGWLFTDNFFRHEPISDYQLELLALYAATIGHLATTTRTLEALRYSESRLRQAMRLAHLGIWEWDIATDKTTWSDEMFEMYGIAAEEFSGKGEDYLNFTHPDDRQIQAENISRAFERTATGSSGRDQFEPDPKEFRLVRPDGTICYVRGDAVAVVDGDGQPVQMFGILMDITERIRAEKQTLELALVREREENTRNFLDTLSHDLKTPLTVIKTGLYLLERITDPDTTAERLKSISAQVVLLEKYVADLLAYSRLEHLPDLVHQSVNVNLIIENIASRLHTAIEQKGLSITLDLVESPAPVMGDLDELDRMLVNLIENAVNYTPTNGSLVVRTYVEDCNAIIEITDTGIGINEADLPHIFDRFYRAIEAREVSKHGSGLGLAIVKRIVELHAGDIEVLSSIGQGTTFRIRLPLIENLPHD